MEGLGLSGGGGKAERKNMNLSEIEEEIKNITATEQTMEEVKKTMDDQLTKDLENLQEEKNKMEAAYKRQQRQLEAQHRTHSFCACGGTIRSPQLILGPGQSLS